MRITKSSTHSALDVLSSAKTTAGATPKAAASGPGIVSDLIPSGDGFVALVDYGPDAQSVAVFSSAAHLRRQVFERDGKAVLGGPREYRSQLSGPACRILLGVAAEVAKLLK